MRRLRWLTSAVLSTCVLAAGAARAEVVEEIVAWVNGEVITKSDMEQEEQMLLADIYRRYTGPELDEQARRVRADLLDRMIERKILVQRAAHLYDVQKMGEGLLSEFKQNQKIKNDDELRRLLAQEGMTLDELKQRLIDIYAPEQIIRFEVVDRVSVSDKEMQDYYDAHPEMGDVPARATVREIVILADDQERAQRRAEAEAIRERAGAAGTDFAELAKEVSQAPTREGGGLLGPVGKGDLAVPLEQAAFTVPVGAVSPVIEMPHGFHLIKVEARQDAGRKPLNEVKDSVREAIEQEKYGAMLEAYLKKARAESEIEVKDNYKSRLRRPEGS